MVRSVPLYTAFRPVFALVTLGFLALATTISAEGTERALEILVVGADGQPVHDAVVAAYSGDAGDANEANRASTPTGAPARTAIMDQIALAFSPHVMSIPVGTLVEFPNSDQVRHSIYSFSEPKVFEVKLYRGREASPIAFDRPGVVVLGCNIHDDMLAYLYVFETEHSVVTDEAGRGVLERVPAGPLTVRVRHPRLDEGVLFETELASLPESGRLRIELMKTPPPRAVENRDSHDPIDGLFGAHFR